MNGSDYHRFVMPFKRIFQIRCQELVSQWESLLEKLKSCGSILSSTHNLIAIFTEIDDCLTSMEEMKVCSSINCLQVIIFPFVCLEII